MPLPILRPQLAGRLNPAHAPRAHRVFVGTVELPDGVHQHVTECAVWTLAADLVARTRFPGQSWADRDRFVNACRERSYAAKRRACDASRLVGRHPETLAAVLCMQTSPLDRLVLDYVLEAAALVASAFAEGGRLPSYGPFAAVHDVLSSDRCDAAFEVAASMGLTFRARPVDA